MTFLLISGTIINLPTRCAQILIQGPQNDNSSEFLNIKYIYFVYIDE